jgi:histidyl-tRNA synthetase
MTQRIQALRGMNDVLPEEAAQWRWFYEQVQAVMDLYGYREIILPVMEATELFKRSVGEATDIVEKEMFTFLDREKTSMSLRPEATASCVRAGIEHGLLHNQQQRLWYRGPMFRHERPQAGRYRQFHQVGVEVFGMAGPETDFEVIALSARILRRLGLLDAPAGSSVKLELNSLGTLATRASYRAALVDYLTRHQADLDEDSRRRLQTNPLRILDSKHARTREILRDAPAMAEHLDTESIMHFEAVQSALREAGIEFALNPTLVRGLDYYTRTVFEWTTDRLGAQGTVCAGGRYDGLVAQLGGADTPAVGFAMGVERILQLCRAVAIPAGFEENQRPDAYLCWLGDQAYLPALRLAEELRGAANGGIRLVVNAGGGGFKAQFKRADKSGARFALILGEEEARANQIQVKPLREEGAQQAVALDKVKDFLLEKLGLDRPGRKP